MFIRKCKICKKDVHVESKCATIVTCVDCKQQYHKIYKSRDYDTDDSIYCRICNKVKKSLINHIKKTHNISINQYLIMYPDAPVQSKNTISKKRSRSIESRAKTSKTSKAAWQCEQYRTKQIFRLKKHRNHWKMSEEGIEHIKQGQDRSVKMQKRRENSKQRAIVVEQEIRKLKTNLKEFIVCPLCVRSGKDLIDSRCKFITFKHLQTHNYTTEQFKKEFLEHEFKIQSLKTGHSESLLGENHFNFCKELSLQTKHHISESIVKFYEKNFKICLRCGKKMSFFRKTNICCNCSRKIYGFEDGYDAVFCRICFKLSGNLTQHVVNEHKITIRQYKQRYPDANLLSKSTRDKIFREKDDCQKESLKQTLKINIQKKNELKVVLEKNFNVEDYNYLFEKKIPVYCIDSYEFVCCRICLRFMKKISSEHLLGHNLTTWMYRQLFPDAQLTARSVINKAISKGVDTKIKAGTLSTRDRGYSGVRKDIGHHTRSMIEANFCRILIYNNVKYKYEPRTFPLEHHIYSSYTPDILLLQDFHVWKKGIFLELKGFKMDIENEAKMEIFQDKYPSVAIEVVYRNSKDMKNLERKFKAKIKLWETSDRNIVKTPMLYV